MGSFRENGRLALLRHPLQTAGGMRGTSRRAFRADLHVDNLPWARGAAWAFEQAMGAVWYYVDSNPAMSLMGRRTLQRITTDPSAVRA